MAFSHSHSSLPLYDIPSFLQLLISRNHCVAFYILAFYSLRCLTFSVVRILFSILSSFMRSIYQADYSLGNMTILMYIFEFLIEPNYLSYLFMVKRKMLLSILFFFVIISFLYRGTTKIWQIVTCKVSG